MKFAICFITIIMLMFTGCNQTTRVFDSEIAALNRQTQVLAQQNQILKRIAIALENRK